MATVYVAQDLKGRQTLRSYDGRRYEICVDTTLVHSTRMRYRGYDMP